LSQGEFVKVAEAPLERPPKQGVVSTQSVIVKSRTRRSEQVDYLADVCTAPHQQKLATDIPDGC
jgi:hypothetical protein